MAACVAASAAGHWASTERLLTGTTLRGRRMRPLEKPDKLNTRKAPGKVKSAFHVLGLANPECTRCFLSGVAQGTGAEIAAAVALALAVKSFNCQPYKIATNAGRAMHFQQLHGFQVISTSNYFRLTTLVAKARNAVARQHKPLNQRQSGGTDFLIFQSSGTSQRQKIFAFYTVQGPPKPSLQGTCCKGILL